MSSGRILYLSRADVERVALPMSEVMSLLDAMFVDKGEGRTEMPPKPGIHPGGRGNDNFIHAMPALIEGERLRAAGMKWVSGFPGNVARGLPYITGLIVLNDPETGVPEVVMDATWVTAVRTGAATGVAARRLARADSAVIGILGCGVQGRTNLDALAVALPALAEVRAYDLDPARTRSYIEEMSSRPEYGRLRFVVAGTAREAVVGADVIVTAGPIRARPEPVLEADWLAPGSLLVPLDYDSYVTRGAMHAAARFYTDDRGQLIRTREGGVYFQGIPEIYGDLGELATGRCDGRRDAAERLLCMNLGIALEDMAVAPTIAARARERGIGSALPL